jgi:hypothetical protein
VIEKKPLILLVAGAEQGQMGSISRFLSSSSQACRRPASAALHHPDIGVSQGGFCNSDDDQLFDGGVP